MSWRWLTRLRKETEDTKAEEKPDGTVTRIKMKHEKRRRKKR